MEDNNRNDILLDDILGGIHGFNANDAEWDTYYRPNNPRGMSFL